MIRLHIIYQWRSDEITGGFFRFWGSIKKNPDFQISLIDIDHYDLKNLPKADFIIFSNVINGKSLMIAEEAARTGIATIYDSRIDGTGSESLSNLVQESSDDLRTINMVDRLIRQVDLVTSDSIMISEKYPVCSSYLKVVESDDLAAWKALFEGICPASTSERKIDGEKIFIIAPTFMWPHHYICDMITSSFMTMGHNVHLFTVRPTNFLSEAICWKKEFDPKFLQHVTFHQDDAWKIVPLIEKESPDLIFTVQGYTIPRQILQEVKNLKIPFAAWFMDEPYDSARSISFSRYFTHVFLQDSSSLKYHRHFGNPNTFYLPHGCLPDPLAESPRTYKRDIALLGNPFQGRLKLVEYLASKGLRVTVAGNAWNKALKEFKNIQVVDNIPLDSTSEFFRETKILLNMHRSSDDFTTNKDVFNPESPNGTLFYIAASAGFQIVDSGRDELKEFFEVNKEIVTFDSESDCYKKIMHYLSHEDERDKIRLAGHKRALQDNTYNKRLEKMLSVIEEEKLLPLDSGHRRIGFITETNATEKIKNIPESCCCTILTKDEFDQEIKNSVKILIPDKNKGFASALNAAIFETPADYFIIGNCKCDNTLFYEELVDRFESDINLGLIILKTEDVISGFIIPQRILDETGTLQYGDAETCLKDLENRVIDTGYTVKKIMQSGSPIKESSFSIDLTEQEKNGFYREWTSDHVSRLKARKLLRLLETNSYKISPDEAFEILKDIAVLSPEFSEAQKRLAELLLKKGKFRNALDCYKNIWKMDPDDPFAILSYAAVLIIIKEFDKALELLDSLSETDASSLQIGSMHYQRGRIMLAKGDQAAAMESFRTVLQFDPTHLNAMKEIGLLMFSNNDADSALQQLNRALVFADDKSGSEILNDMGVVYWHKDDIKRALDFFVKALEKNPANKSTVINLATVGRGLISDEEIKEYIYDCLGFYPHDIDLLKLLEAISKNRADSSDMKTK
ncbi:MAG: glycosyltransferase [Dissulfurispiraceae bacterium]|jgi:spore maturation protein CgeB|nr:glycosyltransferase [Dissulfurispiraceae bacterium]